MARIVELKQPIVKSKPGIIDCLRRVLKLARHKEISVVAVVFVGVDGKVYCDRLGPLNVLQQDLLLDAIDKLHEDVISAI